MTSPQKLSKKITQSARLKITRVHSEKAKKIIQLHGGIPHARLLHILAACSLQFLLRVKTYCRKNETEEGFKK
jgi:hypothetical protein